MLFPVCRRLYVAQPCARVVCRWISSSHSSHGPLFQSLASSTVHICFLSPRTGGRSSALESSSVCLFLSSTEQKKQNKKKPNLRVARPREQHWTFDFHPSQRRSRALGNPATLNRTICVVFLWCSSAICRATPVIAPSSPQRHPQRPPGHLAPHPPPPPPLPYRWPTLLSEPAGL